MGALFEAHGRMVFALCRMLLRSLEDAEDATQQTFLLAHRSLLGGAFVDRPAGWLATIARNECYRRLGRTAPESVALDHTAVGGEDPASVVDRQAEIEALSAALAELPASQREAIVLREFYGLSYVEVAAALGVSGPAVESLIFKSRRRLQERLRPIRSAAGALAFPLALRDALAEQIPGFLGGSTGAVAGSAVIAKIGAAPAAAKLAGVMLALGAGSAMTVAGAREQSPGPPIALAGVGLVRQSAPKREQPAAAPPPVTLPVTPPPAPVVPVTSGRNDEQAEEQEHANDAAEEPEHEPAIEAHRATVPQEQHQTGLAEENEVEDGTVDDGAFHELSEPESELEAP